ncbi:MAG: hypothetical protein ICV79_18355 [Flavisolibacter sp.]|nr:hypothetical protein [Flavisolibacter sp.]
MNKAPLGGLYTPAVRRVRQANCHHLYNCETVANALFLVTHSSPEPVLIKVDDVDDKNYGQMVLFILELLLIDNL